MVIEVHMTKANDLASDRGCRFPCLVRRASHPPPSPGPATRHGQRLVDRRGYRLDTRVAAYETVNTRRESGVLILCWSGLSRIMNFLLVGIDSLPGQRGVIEVQPVRLGPRDIAYNTQILMHWPGQTSGTPTPPLPQLMSASSMGYALILICVVFEQIV